MFDVGFSELLVIAVVALLVLGPERLPKAARFAGLWVRRARSQWNSVRSEFERELADDELKRTLRDTQQSLREAHASLREAGGALQRDFTEASEDLMRGPQPPLPAEPGVTPYEMLPNRP
jgi:sec-independent protein translocase protein TatB